MTIQDSTAVRNARLDAFEAAVGTSPKLQLRSGAQPANCAAADAGTLLCEMTLPVNWMNDAASGTKTLAGTWSGTGVAAGTIAHFRFKDSAGTTCHRQGSVSITGGGGDMIVDNTNIAVSQTVNVTTFTLTAGGA